MIEMTIENCQLLAIIKPPFTEHSMRFSSENMDHMGSCSIVASLEKMDGKGTLQESNMGLENTLFIGDFPAEMPISSGFPITGGYPLVTIFQVEEITQIKRPSSSNLGGFAWQNPLQNPMLRHGESSCSLLFLFGHVWNMIFIIFLFSWE